MASKLLNVLTNIENDRRYLIGVANNAGYSINENAKLRQLDTAIRSIEEPTEIPLNGIPEEYIMKHDWIRPTEWPDCHQILLDTERVKIGNTTNYHEPYMIIMLEADGPTTTFYKSTGLSNNAVGDCIGYSALLTSDGTFYNTNATDITHTWDTSKDIVVNSGEFPGTYRWVIYFNQTNQSVAGNQKLIRYLPAVEIIVDASNCIQNVQYVPVCFFKPNSTIAGDGALNTTLLNEEVFNAGVSLTLSGGNTNPYVYMFRGCTNLRNLDFHGLTGSLYLNNGSYMFKDCYRLRHIDLSYLTTALSGNAYSIFQLSNCFSLVDFKGPHTTQSAIIYANYIYGLRMGYNPQLELVQLDLGENTSGEITVTTQSGSDFVRTYIPKTARFTGADFVSTTLPYNWNGHSYWGNKIYKDLEYPSTSTQLPVISATMLDREVIDYSNVLSLTNENNTSYSVYKNGNAKFNLMSAGGMDNMLYSYAGFLSLPNDIVIRLNLYYWMLSKENVIRLFNALKDLTEDDRTVYNPQIILNPVNIDELTPEEIAIATNKGWTVVS